MNISAVTYGEMALQDVKKGVIRIMTNDGTEYYQGSGFAIGIQGEPVTYIVTNYHVVEDMVEINLYFDENSQYPLEVTDIVFRDNDIALVKLQEPLDSIQPLILETEKNAESGDNIYALGFPGISDSLDESFTGYPEDITITSGIISKIAETNNTKFYQIDATISGGNSGGPLINEQGYVIGINSFGILNEDGSAAAGYNGSYLLDRLITKLKEKDIPYTSSKDIAAEAISTPDESNQTEEVEQTDQEEQNIEENNAGNQDTLGNVTKVAILIGGSLLLITTIFIGVSMSQSKKKARQQIVAPVVVVTEQVIKTPQIIGISGYQAGRVYNMGGSMTFGRNPACKVNYPENHKGISGNHCSLQYDDKNDLFLLTDMGSSYGTFLENSQMIQKNLKITLRHGDKFYLADPNEMFQIR